MQETPYSKKRLQAKGAFPLSKKKPILDRYEVI
jgi:hypothetical protein